MAASQPTPSFLIRFARKDITPWGISLSVLARTLAAVQGLIYEDQAVDAAGTATAGPDQSRLHLLGVRRGSATYPVFAEAQEFVLSQLQVAGQVIVSPDTTSPVSHMLNAMKELSAIAKSVGCPVEITTSDKNDVIAVIEPETYKHIHTAVLVTGDTSISGKIVRVGGATRLHCHMRIPRQRRLLICGVSDKGIAQQLGRHLYEVAVVSGRATWFRKTWRIHRFLIKSMHQVSQDSLSEKIDRLRRVGGEAWSEIRDADEFIRSVRGED